MKELLFYICNFVSHMGKYSIPKRNTIGLIILDITHLKTDFNRVIKYNIIVISWIRISLRSQFPFIPIIIYCRVYRKKVNQRINGIILKRERQIKSISVSRY